MKGLTYITGYGAGSKDITCREPLASTTQMSDLLKWRPVEFLEICFRDRV